jgi:hypothetical protein
MSTKKQVETLLRPTLPDIRQRTALLEESQASSTSPSHRNSIEMKMSMEHYENNNEMVNHSNRRTTCLNAIVSNTNPVRTDQELNTSSGGGESLRTLLIRNCFVPHDTSQCASMRKSGRVMRLRNKPDYCENHTNT